MKKASLFLDSGAFSALMCNKPLDIEDYIAYVKDHLDVWDIYANLDDISCPEKTWVNQRKMEAAGLTPLPVYHATEDLKYLRMAMEYDYFAVGGMAGGNKASLQYQVDGIFSIICPESNDFYPLNKVHGFGITKPAFVVSYPWYSVDSSSWVRYGLFGMVLIPKISFGNYLYNVPPMPIVMSNRSKSIGEGQHFANTSAIEQAAITKYFADKGLAVGESVIIDVDAGYELKEDEVFINKTKTKIERILVRGLVNDHTIRDQANLMYYLDLEKNQQAWPWQWLNKSGRLF